MYVQKIRTKENRIRYILLDDNDKVVESVRDYLKYLDSKKFSPNTLKNYAYHLKLYFEYLRDIEISFDKITENSQELIILSEFISYLRKLDEKVIYNQYSERPERRTASTINAILSAVLSFYKFLFRRGILTRELNVYREGIFSSYKGFFYEMGTGKKTYATSVLKLKEKDRIVKTVSREEVKLMIEHCHYIRDKFLITLLFESGLRLGEVLGLRKGDIVVWDNTVKIIVRDNMENGVSVKNKAEGEVIIPHTIMELYFEYLNTEYIENDNQYVFVNLKGANKGKPMKEITVEKLFYRLSKENDIRVTPHILRHSHATEFIKIGN